MNMNSECALMNRERNLSTFSIIEMTYLLDGGKHKTAHRHHIEKVILSDPRMKTDDDVSYLSPEQQHIHGVKRMIYFYTDLAKKMNWDYTDTRSPDLEFLPRTVGLYTALMVHPSAFIPTIASLGTKEQVEKWYKLSKEYYILGAYAQTELGHGTNLRKLETTATFDLKSQGFILHSPNITSMKWWPGEMGKCSNHALVMAQLIIGEKSHGMQAFLVQIRDLTTHQPMPGVSVGSIGPTMAMGGSDNGYLSLKCMWIPKANMLAKYAEVTSDGTLVKKGNDKLMYASMVNLRVLMTKGEAVLALAKACTIAGRYSCIRRQGSLENGKSEVPIIEYVTQQHKVLPQIAAAYALHFTIQHVQEVYNDFLKQRDQGRINNLAELHVITASMKASMTEQCVEGIEIVRRACGGHGFAHSSGLPALLQRATASCTYEGENTVMYLQCARYLIGCASKIYMGQTLDGSVQYLSKPMEDKSRVIHEDEFVDLNVLVACFEHRVQALLTDTATSMQSLVANGMDQMSAWNLSSVQLVDVAKAHAMQYIVSSFTNFIKNTSCSLLIRDVLNKLCALYALHHINNNTRGFVKDGYLNGHQLSLAQKAEITLLLGLRKNTVALVDSFDFRDDILHSCLGAYDGNVYERLVEYAKKSPMNKSEVNEEIYKYLRPHLHIGRDKLNEMTKQAKL